MVIHISTAQLALTLSAIESGTISILSTLSQLSRTISCSQKLPISAHTTQPQLSLTFVARH